MKQGKCEFDALIGAQGIVYRCGTWMRSRRCIAMNSLSSGSVGLVAMIVVAGVVAFPTLIMSTEQDLIQLLRF